MVLRIDIPNARMHAMACFRKRTPRTKLALMNSLRVLVADDHAVLREGLAMLIDAQPDMGVVAQARGGREATQLAQRFHPDVVVLDVSMPDLDGAEAAEQIRAD